MHTRWWEELQSDVAEITEKLLKIKKKWKGVFFQDHKIKEKLGKV